MSQLISSLALRRVQTLSNSFRRLQANQVSRYCSIENKPTLLKPIAFFGVSQQRTLYGESSLGLEKVASLRENKSQLYRGHKERYIERLASYLESGNAHSILKDDVTNLIGLSENEQHLDLLEKIIASLKSVHDYSDSGWGTAVVRLYCSMDQVDRAYNAVKDFEKYGQFFNQYTTYRITLTMLYNAGRYNEVLEIYQVARDRLENTRPDDKFFHIPGLAVVVFAALAKTNTIEALNQAEKLYNEIDFGLNNFLKTRFITFLSHMALQHDKPALAMNLISDAKSKNYVALRELKTLSLLKLKRYEDIVYHLRDSIARNRENTTRPEKTELVLKEVLDAVEASLNEIEDEATRQTLSDTLVEMKQGNYIGESTLDSIMFSPLKYRSNLPGDDFGGKQQYIGRQRYTQNSNYVNRFVRDDDNFTARGDSYSRGDNYSRGDSFSRGDNYSRGGDRFGGQRRGERSDNYGRRNNNFNDRSQRDRSKSYFEDDPDGEDFDDAISTQKRFR